MTKRMIGLLLILLVMVVGNVWANGRATTVTYSYDDAGRLVSADYGTDSITYTYDTNGNLVQRLTNAVPTAISLDSFGVQLAQGAWRWLVVGLLVVTLFVIRHKARRAV